LWEHPTVNRALANHVGRDHQYVGMSCVCKDNHLLRCCIDIYYSSTLYIDKLDELKLSDDNTILTLVIITHTIHHHYIAPTLTHSLTEYLKVKVTLRLIVGQSVSLTWGSWPDIYYCLTVTVLFLWGVLSDERTGLSFVYAAGSRQRSLSRVWVPWISRPYFTVSVLRLPFSSPPTTRSVTVEVFDPASTRVTEYFYHYVFLDNLESDLIENTSLSVLL
jgi:hypothetical protein